MCTMLTLVEPLAVSFMSRASEVFGFACEVEKFKTT